MTQSGKAPARLRPQDPLAVSLSPSEWRKAAIRPMANLMVVVARYVAKPQLSVGRGGVACRHVLCLSTLTPTGSARARENVLPHLSSER